LKIPKQISGISFVSDGSASGWTGYVHQFDDACRGRHEGKLGRHKLDFGLLFPKTLEDSYPAATVHRFFTTALAVGKKRKKSEEAVAATRSLAQSAKELLYGEMGSAIIDANSEGSSFGLSLSGFALLPMRGLPFDMWMNQTDRWVLPDSSSSILILTKCRNLSSINLELDAAQGFFGSELSNDFSNFMDSYSSNP
jgi:hypothetical protein